MLIFLIDKIDNEMKVLISAYAFSPEEPMPFSSGEDLLGWKLVQQINKKHKIWILTQSVNRDAVMTEMAKGELEGTKVIFIGPSRYKIAFFAAEQRNKESSIRKVLGASIPQIVRLLSREFTIWILIANVIAWPVAYYALNLWLQNFVYRENIDLLIFVSAAILAFLIAVFSGSFQFIKAALSNPVDSLWYE